MVRVHLTCEDQLGITVVTVPDRLCEALFSLDVLRQPGDEILYGRWRRTTRTQLSAAA